MKLSKKAVKRKRNNKNRKEEHKEGIRTREKQGKKEEGNREEKEKYNF